MKFQHDASWDNYNTIFNLKLPIKQAWEKIIDFHEQIDAKPYWAALRSLDVEAEQTNIKNWMERLVTNDPIPENVVALWMSFVKLEDENSVVSVICLQGTEEYDWEDTDWTASVCYEPDSNYGVLEVLNQIDLLTKNGDPEEAEFLEWILPLAYCSFTLDEIIRTKLNKSLFLRYKEKLFVTTGHEDGDWKNVSPIR